MPCKGRLFGRVAKQVSETSVCLALLSFFEPGAALVYLKRFLPKLLEEAEQHHHHHLLQQLLLLPRSFHLFNFVHVLIRLFFVTTFVGAVFAFNVCAVSNFNKLSVVVQDSRPSTHSAGLL